MLLSPRKYNTHICTCKIFSNNSFISQLIFKGVDKSIEEYVIDEVRRRRIEMGISQAALADYINVSRGFIGDVENPKRRAKYNLQLINEIAKVLKCSPRDFLPPEPLG